MAERRDLRAFKLKIIAVVLLSSRGELILSSLNLI